MTRDSPFRPDHELDFERLLFFSDAVFAIAITLLIIENRLPTLPEKATDDEIRAALSRILPEIFAYALSFATIGLYWFAHWRRYRDIERVDGRLVGLNLILLAFVAFVPFPTALIGEHGDVALPVVIYVVSLSTAGIMGPLTWLSPGEPASSAPRSWPPRPVRDPASALGAHRDARFAGAAALRAPGLDRGQLAADRAGPDRHEPGHGNESGGLRAGLRQDPAAGRPGRAAEPQIRGCRCSSRRAFGAYGFATNQTPPTPSPCVSPAFVSVA
jgi:hypothetical protein